VHHYELLGLIVNLVLAVGTILIAIYAVIQAKATQRSADVAEKTLTLVAADIHIHQVGLVPQGVVQLHSYIAITVKNYGGTRAENVRSNIKTIIPGVPDSADATTEFVLAPSESQMIRFRSFNRFVTQATFDQIVAGQIKVKFAGTVTYKDIFGNTKTLTVNESTLNPAAGAFYFGLPDEEEP
jgi:hypothetical protein